jgi:hypothetical protein
MQKRLKTALVPAIAVATLALGAAQFAATDAAASPKRLDELSAKRPAAASQLAELAPYGIAQGAAENAFAAVVVDAQRQAIIAELARIEAEQAASGNRRSSGAGGASSGDFLECTKQRESHGNYDAVSGSGTYRGAYQFHPSTWDNTAEHAGRADLVGADPATAAPADQDAMAQELLSWQGTAPWGGRC